MASPAPVSQVGEIAANMLAPFGTLEIGTSLSILLLGIATLQTWNYIRDYPNDSLYLRATVTGLYVAEFLHTSFFVHSIYQWTIIGPAEALRSGSTTILESIPLGVQAALVIGALIIVTVQGFFCMRVYRVTQSKVLAFGCGFLVAGRLCLNLSLMADVTRDGRLAVTKIPSFKWQAVAEMSSGAVSDICIATCMCIGLLQRRSGFAPTTKLVDRLVAFTIGTGLLTSICSTIELLTYVAMPTNFVWIACFGVVSKLFSNSLLASLNQRRFHQTGTFRTAQTSGGASTHIEFHRGTAGIELQYAGDAYGPTKPALDVSRDSDSAC